MKKYAIVLLVLALLLCAGCDSQEAVQTTKPAETTAAPTEATTLPAETTEATVPAPALGKGFALVPNTPAVMGTLMRDDVVDVVGKYDEDHYVIKTELGYGLVKKDLLRLDGEEAYKVWNGFATHKAEVYDNMNLTGEPAQTLKLNTNIEVLDDIVHCYVVKVGDTIGFMVKSTVSKWRIEVDSTGADGGDISLQFQGGIVRLGAILQEGEVSGKAVVLADGTEIILGYFARGEEIPVVLDADLVEGREGYVTVYMEGVFAYVPGFLVVPEGAAAYEEWDGYCSWNGKVYEDYYMVGDPLAKLSVNTSIHVFAELEDCYAVNVNGTVGYMAKNWVSRNKIQVSSGSNDDAEWSPPAM